MAKKLVIFGIGKIGQVVLHHFKTDSDFEVAGFTTDAAYVPESGSYEGLPVVDFTNIEKQFDPKTHSMFVAVGYHQMNQLRAERLKDAKAKGYATTSYVSSTNKHILPEQLGENCFVMSGEPLQPKSKIGDNCFIWANAVIGHHSEIGNHCWITSGVTIGGNVRLGDYAFVGLGATLGHEITLGNKCFIGAGALVTKDSGDESVFVAADTDKFRLTSSQFFKMTNMQ